MDSPVNNRYLIASSTSASPSTGWRHSDNGLDSHTFSGNSAGAATPSFSGAASLCGAATPSSGADLKTRRPSCAEDEKRDCVFSEADSRRGSCSVGGGFNTPSAESSRATPPVATSPNAGASPTPRGRVVGAVTPRLIRSSRLPNGASPSYAPTASARKRKADKRMEIFVVRVVSPSEFYIQLKEDQLQLEKLMKDLNKELKDSSPEQNRVWREDETCAILDDVLHRGKIVRVWSRGMIVRRVLGSKSSGDGEPAFWVKSVDYGGLRRIHVKDLRGELDPAMAQRHAFAIRARLLGIAPLKGEVWHDSVISTFSSIVGSGGKGGGGDIVMYKIQKTFENALQIALQIKSADGRTFEDVAEMLTMKGLARLTSLNEEAAEMSDRHRRGSKVKSSSPSCFKLVPFVAKPSAAACRLWEEEPRPRLSSWLPFERPSTPRFQAVVTFVDEGGVVWAALKTLYDEGRLGKLNQEVSEAAKKSEEPEGHSLKDIRVGQSVLAQFPLESTGFWYRANFESWSSSSSSSAKLSSSDPSSPRLSGSPPRLRVRYVDFGDSAFVAAAQVRLSLPPVAIATPLLSLRLRLAGVAPKGGRTGGWKTRDLDFLYDRLVGKTVGVELGEGRGGRKDGCLLAEILTPDGTNVADLLVEKGWAVKTSAEESGAVVADKSSTKADKPEAASSADSADDDDDLDLLLPSDVKKKFKGKKESSATKTKASLSFAGEADLVQEDGSNYNETNATILVDSRLSNGDDASRLSVSVGHASAAATDSGVASAENSAAADSTQEVPVYHLEEKIGSGEKVEISSKVPSSVLSPVQSPMEQNPLRDGNAPRDSVARLKAKVDAASLRVDVRKDDDTRGADSDSVLSQDDSLPRTNACLSQVKKGFPLEKFSGQKLNTIQAKVGLSSQANHLHSFYGQSLVSNRLPFQANNTLPHGLLPRVRIPHHSVRHSHTIPAQNQNHIISSPLAKNTIPENNQDQNLVGNNDVLQAINDKPLIHIHPPLNTTTECQIKGNKGTLQASSLPAAAAAAVLDAEKPLSPLGGFHERILKENMERKMNELSVELFDDLPGGEEDVDRAKNSSASGGDVSRAREDAAPILGEDDDSSYRVSNSVGSKSSCLEPCQISEVLYPSDATAMTTTATSMTHPPTSPSPDEGIGRDDDDKKDDDDDGVDEGNSSFEDGILWSPIVLQPKLPSSKKGFITEGSFWNMAVPEEIDFCFEITQWESGRIFHYRYLLDDNNDLRRAELDHVSADGHAHGETKGEAKVPDPQIKVNCVMAKLFQNYMQTQAPDWPRAKNPSVGFPCAVKWRQDGVWYRGVVVKLLDGDHAKSSRSFVVQFVDFGNRDFAHLDDLRLLPTDALIPPALATRAKVHGLNNEFSKAVFDFVFASTVEKPLHGILKGTWRDVSGQVVPEMTVWKLGSRKFILKKLVDVGLLCYTPSFEERTYMKAKSVEGGGGGGDEID